MGYRTVLVSDDVQRASLLKRISALILDFIILTILSTFFIFLISFITKYDSYNTHLNECYSKYEKQYGVEFSISSDEYYGYSEEERALYDEAYNALINDEDTILTYQKVVNLSLLSVSLGVFFAFIIAEFIIPIFFKNGVTIGKKVFSLCLMRRGGWRVNNTSLFIRAILGKYTIETMVPLLILMMVFFSSIGIVGPIVIGGIILINLILIFATKDHLAIHDLLADTVVVDYMSQYIYETEEDVIERKKELAKEKAEKSLY